MINNKFKFLSLSILMALVLVSFASAAPICSRVLCGSIIDSPTNVEHNTDVVIQFSVTYEGVNDPETLLFSGTSNIGSWTILPEDTFISPQNTLEFIGTLNIPEYTEAGLIDNAVIKVDIGSTEFDIFIPLITIESTPSISIELEEPLTKTDNGSVVITNTGNVELTNVDLEVVLGSDDFEIEFLISDTSETFVPINLIPGDSEEVLISSQDLENLDFADDNIITIRATSLEANSSEISLEVPVKFCGDCENEGDLNIKDMTFSVETGFGEDDNFWYPFDEIEVEVEVENKGNWKIDNIEIETCLLDKEEGTCVIDERDMSISKKKFNLDEKGRDDEISVLINFEVNAKDLEVKSNNYEFYVKATGKIDDKDAPEELDGEKTCASDSKEIEIRTDDDFVILNNFEFSEIMQCGAETEIAFDVWNIADKKIDSENIYIHIYNNDLKIDEIIDVEDIKALDNEKVEFILNIPSQLEEGWYPLEFKAYDDEDCSEGDIYENSEEDKASYKIYIKVEGNCIVEAEINVVATVELGGNAGQKLVVNTVITNPLNELASYDLDLAGYDSWASSASLDQSNIFLEAGESKEVVITFDVKSDSEGKESSFDILFSGQDIVSSEKHIEGIIIAEQKGFLAGITGNIIGGGNWYLWGIGALNVLLVLIIIVVAFKVAKKNSD